MTDDDSRDALLVGAGNIGALYDLDRKPDADPLTHPICPDHLPTGRVDRCTGDKP